MDSRIQVYLVDILTSIDRIESFFEGKQMRYEDYHTDSLMQKQLSVQGIE